jgi:hypothetical protein
MISERAIAAGNFTAGNRAGGFHIGGTVLAKWIASKAGILFNQSA